MLQVRPFDIEIGQHKVMLNVVDARERGLNAGDRVRVRTKGSATTAILDVTLEMVKAGEIGIFTEALKELKNPTSVDVLPAPKPASLCYIKSIMDKKKLTEDQIRTIVRDIVDNNLSDIELSAYVTASYIHNMDSEEVFYLTKAMIDTGERIHFDTHPVMDKHSIGGVPGNKVSLLVVPIVAAAGLLIPKTSSRAITGAGGTADLMEILAPVEFSADEIKEMTEKVGGVIVWGGATNIAPADDRFIMVEYPFRIDATGQMLASVMAKKSAVGADLAVIDIPVGAGTKVPTVQDGRRLASQFMELGERLNIHVECALTYGESLVGHSIGPNLEVNEALAVLEGAKVPGSLIQKSLALSGIILEMAGKAARSQGYAMAEGILTSGKALEKLRQIIEIQGGKPDVQSRDIVPGEHYFVVKAPLEGYVVGLNNRSLITIARAAGAPHDRGAGLIIHAKKGTKVKQGEPIITIYAERSWRLQKAIELGRQLMPVLVEGMLLGHISPVHWV